MLINKKWTFPVIAISVALVITTIYITTGQNSIDLNTRNLKQNKKIKKIETTENAGKKIIKIECKNGESYEILFNKTTQNYDDLIFNYCGEEGIKQIGDN